MGQFDEAGRVREGREQCQRREEGKAAVIGAVAAGARNQAVERAGSLVAVFPVQRQRCEELAAEMQGGGESGVDTEQQEQQHDQGCVDGGVGVVGVAQAVRARWQRVAISLQPCHWLLKMLTWQFHPLYY